MGRPPKTPNDELDKFLLRMPEGLRDQIKEAADRNGRSMNAEIIARIENAPVAEDAFKRAVERMEEFSEDLKYSLEVDRWMMEQHRGLTAIITEVVKRNGHLDEGFVSALKLLLDSRGQNTEFPEKKDRGSGR